MQTLNLVENASVEFNSFKIFDTTERQDNYRKLALAEQLQTSLNVEQLLNIFAMEVAKFIDFSGLYFKQADITAQARGSKAGKKERSFELKINGQYLGTLTYALNSPISLANSKVIRELHQLILYPIHNAIKYQQAMMLAMQDGLTGLGNRRYFDEQLKRAMHHANRQGSTVGMMVCDLNKFKAVNDTYGHHIGDKVLLQFSYALKESVRDSDSLFRFGGDEFVVLVENACYDSLLAIECRINQAINANAVMAKYHVGCSIGATLMTRSDDAQSFFERADQILYKKKIAKPTKLNVV
jgi:diguanylate cyclase (GGDEF)-like protein